MRAIRIGNDIVVRWSIFRNGKPVDLEDDSSQRRFYLTCKQETVPLENPLIKGNQITYIFQGRDQKYPGEYRLLYKENEGEVGMHTMDSVGAFVLVDSSCKSGGEDSCQCLKSESVEMTSNLAVPSDGLSAYEIARRNGFTGTEQEWIESLGHITRKTTWADLKALRDGGNLIPGQEYRLTDYRCTTLQDGTRPAGHSFDIILMADSPGSLNENARAVLHDGDEYFAGCNMAAWKLMYCLDNDSERFPWADTENGRGVIYRMIDEYGNDCPYDFKNILFARYSVTECAAIQSLVGHLCSNGIDGVTVNPDNPIYCHTFNKDETGPEDTTVLYSSVKNNVIGSGQGLNDIVLFGSSCFDNSFGIQCKEMTANDNFYGNKIGSFCSKNRFLVSCYANTFGNGCNNNILAGMSYGCKFGTSCHHNTVDGYSNYISLGNNCNYNSIGNTSYNNTFGNSCSYNSIGNLSYMNTFGNQCKENVLGKRCIGNTFGDLCKKITLSDYSRYNTIAKNVVSCIVKGTFASSSSKYLQYVHVWEGVSGTDSSPVTISVEPGVNYQTYVALDSSRNIKHFCLADLIK